MAINTQAINPMQWGVSKLSGALASVTVNPVKDLITYMYPRLGASLNGRVEIKEGVNSPMSQIMSPEAITALHDEVKELMKCADLKPKVKIYTGINAPYEGNGSLFGSVIVVPLEEISKKNFTNKIEIDPLLNAEELEKTKYTFTDNEIRFQFARAIGKMRGYSILKIAARVMILALSIALFFSPFGWMGGLVIFAGATLLYCGVNRYIEQKSDRRAIKILTERFKRTGQTPHDATILATTAAINCLKKIALQNIDKRKESRLCRILLNDKGNFRFDPSTPKLTKRIERLEHRLNNPFGTKATLKEIPNGNWLIAPANFF